MRIGIGIWIGIWICIRNGIDIEIMIEIGIGIWIVIIIGICIENGIEIRIWVLRIGFKLIFGLVLKLRLGFVLVLVF